MNREDIVNKFTLEAHSLRLKFRDREVLVRLPHDKGSLAVLDGSRLLLQLTMTTPTLQHRDHQVPLAAPDIVLQIDEDYPNADATP